MPNNKYVCLIHVAHVNRVTLYRKIHVPHTTQHISLALGLNLLFFQSLRDISSDHLNLRPIISKNRLFVVSESTYQVFTCFGLLSFTSWF